MKNKDIIKERQDAIYKAQKIMLDYTLKVASLLDKVNEKDLVKEEYQKLINAVNNCVITLTNDNIKEMNAILTEAKKRIQDLEAEIFSLKKQN